MAMVQLNRQIVKQVIGGIDWGYTNAGVIQVWAFDGDKRAFLVHEVYQSGKLIEWWVAQAKALKAHFGIDYFVADPSEPAYIAAMQRAGMTVYQADNEVAPGIQNVQSRLKRAGDGRPRLHVLRNARTEVDADLQDRRLPTCTIDEFPEYAWAVKPGGQMKEEPVKRNDHGLDTLRYVIHQIDGQKQKRGYTF